MVRIVCVGGGNLLDPCLQAGPSCEGSISNATFFRDKNREYERSIPRDLA